MRRSFSSVGVCALAAVLGSAEAGASQSTNLTLHLNGTISPVCTIEQQSPVALIQLYDAPGAVDVDYRVNCNAPMAVKLTSELGGFEHQEYRQWPQSPGFTGFIPYDAQFSLAVAGASPVSTDSTAMRGGFIGNTGAIPFSADARLHLAWTPAGTLFGGRYRDTVTIRVFGEGT